ncbi:MAG: response regulator [Parafilimonas sp.]
MTTYLLDSSNFFSVFIPGKVINIILICAIIAGLILFFLQREKKLKEKLGDLNIKKDELKELFNNAEQLNKNLVQENIFEKEQTEMLIGTMSYEIHNCVNGIIGMTNILKDTNLNPEQAKNTDIVIRCAKKLLDSAHGNFNSEPSAQNKIINPSDTLGMNNETGWGKISKEFVTQFPLNILVAEDDLINQQLALKLLSKLGYTADIAANGNEALEMVSEKNYDIILMDVLMPEMDGFEATKMIRLCLDTQPIIVAVTASAMSGDRDKCLEAGMDDYICKPIIIEELAALFAKWSKEKKVVL